VQAVRIKTAGADKVGFQSSSYFSVTDTSALADNSGFSGTSSAPAVTNANNSLGVAGAAQSAIDAITAAVQTLGKVQGTVGAGQNKLQYAIQLANSQISSFSAAESRIRDADVASEAANLTKAQVLQQASLAAMAQANSAPQAVLALLRG